MKQIIVIPEGLSIIDNETVPSFVYRAVLDYVVQNHRDDMIIVAPANSFGCDKSEQKAAADYLKASGISCTFFEVGDARYFDSLDNIVELKKYCMRNYITLDRDAIIISGMVHRLRISFLCKVLDLKNKTVRGVSCDTKREAIVPRLWYYQFRYLHYLYEIGALMYHVPQIMLRGLKGRL